MTADQNLPATLTATRTQSEERLERAILSFGVRPLLRVLAGHWSSVLARNGEPVRLGWRITGPDGFYALSVPGREYPAGDGAFPGLPALPADVTYQWYLAGLLRVLAGEQDLTFAYQRRWVAVSGRTPVWRSLQSPTGHEPPLEEQLHQWTI